MSSPIDQALKRAAPRRVRRLRVGDFRQMAEPAMAKPGQQGGEETPARFSDGGVRV